jgi:hypothetical protein
MKQLSLIFKVKLPIKIQNRTLQNPRFFSRIPYTNNRYKYANLIMHNILHCILTSSSTARSIKNQCSTLEVWLPNFSTECCVWYDNYISIRHLFTFLALISSLSNFENFVDYFHICVFTIKFECLSVNLV